MRRVEFGNVQFVRLEDVVEGVLVARDGAMDGVRDCWRRGIALAVGVARDGYPGSGGCVGGKTVGGAAGMLGACLMVSCVLGFVLGGGVVTLALLRLLGGW